MPNPTLDQAITAALEEMRDTAEMILQAVDNNNDWTPGRVQNAYAHASRLVDAADDLDAARNDAQVAVADLPATMKEQIV